MTPSEVFDMYTDVLANACQGLGAAAKALLVAGHGIVRPPRPRFLQIGVQLKWPYIVEPMFGQPGRTAYDLLDRRDYQGPGGAFWDLKTERDCREAATEVIGECGCRPRLVLRALRRLQVAMAWCQDRAAGLEREIDEIFRQQSAWHTLLKREYHFLQLGGGHRP